MFGWFKNKKTDVRLSHLPGFLVEVEVNGNVGISASWPKPTSSEELAVLVKSYVGLLLMLNEGRLLPVFQHAISIYGENNADVNTAKAVLLTFHNYLKDNSTHKANRDGPIVSPTEAFRK